MKFGLFKKESKKTEEKKPAEIQSIDKKEDKQEPNIHGQFPSFQKGTVEIKNTELRNPFEQTNFGTNSGITGTEFQNSKVLKEEQQKPPTTQPTIPIVPALNPDIQRELETSEQQYKSQESTAPFFSDTIIPPPKISDMSKTPKTPDTKEQEFEYKDYTKDYFGLHRIEPIILKPDEEYLDTNTAKGSERQKTGELFININNYKEILQEIKNLKIIIESTNYYLDDAEEHDKKEEKILNELKSRLEDIERKILLIDKIIFEK